LRVAHDVFISYASSDKAVADAVCSQLESIHRIRCWIAPRDVTPGASWAESIIDALDESKIMVLIFSSNANASVQIEREVERAVHKGINIIPLRIENTLPTKTLEYFISAPHWLDAVTVPLESHITKLALSVKALLARHAAPLDVGTPAAVVIPAAVAVPAAAAPVQGAVRPGDAADHAMPPRKQRSMAPVVLGGVAIIAVIAAFLWREGQRPSAEGATASASSLPLAGNTATSTAPTTGAVEAEPLSVPSAAVATLTTAATPAKPATPAAAVAPAVAGKTSNFYVDFRNSLQEGSVTLDIDGQRMWSEKLGAGLKGGAMSAVKMSRPSEDITGALTLPKGQHKMTVTLLTAKGIVKDTKTAPINLDSAVPRTLRIRLSRFKSDLELETVAGQPPPAEKAAADAKPKPAASVKAKSPAAPAASLK